MSSSIAPAAFSPTVPSAKDGTTAAATHASGFSELLDKSASGSARQQASPSPATSSPKAPAHRHADTAPEGRTGDEVAAPSSPPARDTDETKTAAKDNSPAAAGKDGKAAADEEEETGDKEPPKHKTVAIDVSAILFGLSGSGIVNVPQSGANSLGTSAAPASGSQPSDTGATVSGHAKNAPAGATNPNVMQTLLSGKPALPQPTEGGAPRPPGPVHAIPATAVDTPNADAASQQSVSPARLRGVTVIAASGTPPTVAGNPQLAGIGQSAANTTTASNATGADAAGVNTDASGASSGTVSPAASVARPGSPAMDSGGGGNQGSNGHGGGNDAARSPIATSHNAAPQTAGNAAFGGFAGSSAPTLGQTASSFVSGVAGAPTWTAYMSQAAYMANSPAIAAPVRSLAITLQPAELGSVTANLHLSGRQLTIEVEVRTEEARQRLSVDADDIVKSLRSLGFDVSHIAIRHGGNAVLSAAGAGQAQGNAPFQASANSNGGAGGGAMQSNAGNHDGDKNPRAAAPQSKGGDGQSRGLYI
jgi:chemotaxis protein MotD